MQNLNIAKATGPDDIPARVIKVAAKQLAPSFTSVVNNCITQGIFPFDMKKADITPVYKKLDLLMKDNYRPVSVLCTLAKLFEHILANQLNSHFNKIFDKFISAYRKMYSCENILTSVIDLWRGALDKNMVVGSVLMDLSMAFDCLPHRLLIAKLKAYNVSNSACTLIASYLTGRRQRVKVTGQKSGVQHEKVYPKGVGLGP